MSRVKYWTPGNYIEIGMPGNRYSYAVVTNTKLLAVLDYCGERQLASSSVKELDILFIISAHDYAIGKNGWPLAGKIEQDEKFNVHPNFYIEDVITGRFSIVDHNFENRVPATKEECANLERAASWPPKSIEQRLIEHYSAANT